MPTSTQDLVFDRRDKETSIACSPTATTSWISDPTAFDALRAVWNEIALAADPGNLFLRFEWFDAAWQWVKDDAALRILVLQQDDAIIGIVPLMLYRAPSFRPRRLAFLSVPDSQCCGIVCERARFPALAEALGAALLETAAEWDVLEFDKMKDGDHALDALPFALEGHGIGTRIDAFGNNPYIDLTSDWNTFYTTRSRRLKKANNLATNRMNKAGETRIDRITALSIDPVDQGAVLDDVIRISAASWKQATGTSLDNAGPGAFIRRLTEHAIREGWLSLWLLRLNGAVVATEYQLVHAGRVYALRADFDERLEDISPGSFLNRHMLEQLFSMGLARYLMGSGNNQYKRRWTEIAEPLHKLSAYSPSWRGRCWRMWSEQLRPVVKRVALRRKANEHLPADVS